MQITEPMTMATDYALTMTAGFLALRLWKNGREKQQRCRKFWSAALAATAFAALVGGTSHGFALYFNDFAKAAIWKTTVYAIGFVSLFMVAGSTTATVTNPLKKVILGAAVLQFLVYAVWMISHDDFKYVIYEYVPAMLAVLILHIYASVNRDAGSPWMIGGVFVSFAAAGVQQSGFSLHNHFNYNDIYHIIQMLGVYLFYRGSVLLQDQ